MGAPLMEEPLDAQRFAKDAIKQVAGHLPPALLLLPPLSGSLDNPSSWRAVPLYTPGIPEERSDLPLAEMLDGITEAAVEHLNSAMGRGICLSEISPERLLRYIGEIITSKGSPPQADVSQDDQIAWAALRKRLRGTSGLVDLESLPEIFRKRSVLLTDARREECLAVTLPRKTAKNSDSFCEAVFRGVLEHKNASAIMIPNPLIKTLSALCEEAQRLAVTRVTAKSVNFEDRAFIYRLRKEGRLAGMGEYRNFSLEVISQKSEEFVLIAYSLGDRPFLQQVSPEPIYVYWDLKRYPILVYVTVLLGNTKRLPLSCLNAAFFHACCDHPSILKHAFCKGVEGSRTEAAICMEATRDRILGWYRQQPNFDPVICFLEQMRAAGRVLRYGVRARDQAITKHNPFHKVPEAEFQAVIRGLDRARVFAQSRGAEIVPYNR